MSPDVALCRLGPPAGDLELGGLVRDFARPSRASFQRLRRALRDPGSRPRDPWRPSDTYRIAAAPAPFAMCLVGLRLRLPRPLAARSPDQ